MTMTGKERAVLRADSQRLKPTVHVGAAGLTDALLESCNDALRTHEMVKVALGKQLDIPAKVAARQLAESLGADVIQVIGKTTTIYRFNPDLKRSKGDLPPWK